jgi:origin recognition complex subunit 2
MWTIPTLFFFLPRCTIYSAGMPFKDLYSSAREALLLSSDLALRAQLTEFLDHRLARQRRSPEGSELLQLPIDSTVLQHFLEQVEGNP